MTGRPTRVQAKVLKAIHHQAAEINGIVDRAERESARTSARPSPDWYRELEKRVRVQQALETAAVAAGVPQEWVDQVRERGELRMAWRAKLHWRTPAPVDREVLARRLRAEIARVQDLAAVAAAYGERGAQAEPGTASLFDRELRRSSDRVAALTAIFEPSDTEAEQLWGEHTWTAAADSVRDADPATLAERWRAHVRADTSERTHQTVALAAAGLSGDLSTDPTPASGQMVDRIRDLLAREPTPASLDTGHRITTAVDAAALTTGTEFDTTTPTATPAAAPGRAVDRGPEP